MIGIRDRAIRLCDGFTRREAIRLGGLSAVGLTMQHLRTAQGVAAQPTPDPQRDLSPGFGKAKSVILIWLLGGPPQHETWDPKPEAPVEIRGEFGVIDSVTPGIRVGELMPKSAMHTDKLAILRAVVSHDQAHSSSGYQMLTGVPHIPLSQENVTSRPPNLAPSQAAIMRALRPDRDGLPSAIQLPKHIANDGEIIWPGQNAGILGRKFDPWLLTCDPSAADFKVPDLSLPDDISGDRLDRRRSLLSQLDDLRSRAERGGPTGRFAQQASQAFDLLGGNAAQRAFALHEEPDSIRDRYGRYRFGQSALLARRMVEAGVSLVQVNWTRAEGQENGSWDLHKNHFKDLKGFLLPMLDQTYSALLEDLQERGLLDETLVVWVGEFGHTPKINGNAGRDHWGNCFSIALAGAGIRGGIVHGESDAHAAYPLSGIVSPADITATIFHTLGFSPETLIYDQVGRPMPITRGHVIREIVT